MTELERQLIEAPNWEARFRLIIQAARNLPRPDDADLARMQLIAGCEAKLWFGYQVAEKKVGKNDRTFVFQAYSEARILNGLLWIILSHLQGKTAAELKDFVMSDYLGHLGIAQGLSQTRLNGLAQIGRLIQGLAA